MEKEDKKIKYEKPELIDLAGQAGYARGLDCLNGPANATVGSCGNGMVARGIGNCTVGGTNTPS